VHNVRANAAVVLQVRGEAFAALAHVASSEERAAVWERIASEIPQYAGYQHSPLDQRFDHHRSALPPRLSAVPRWRRS
jgi:hypothetical protein